MNIKRQGNILVLRIPLKQKSYDAVDKFTGYTNNLIGIINDMGHYNVCHLSQLIDLGYKDDQQEGDPLICMDEDELRNVCKLYDIDIWTKHENNKI